MFWHIRERIDLQKIADKFNTINSLEAMTDKELEDNICFYAEILKNDLPIETDLHYRTIKNYYDEEMEERTLEKRLKTIEEFIWITIK